MKHPPARPFITWPTACCESFNYQNTTPPQTPPQCCGNGLIVLLTNYEAESVLAAGRAQKQQYEVLQTEKPAELGGGVVVSPLQDHRESDALEMGAMVKVAGLGGGEGSEF